MANYRSVSAAVVAILVLLVSCGKKPVSSVNVLVPVPFTGDAASYGKVVKEGIEIGLDELQNDPVRKKLNVIYRDSRLSLKEIVNIFQQEVAQQPVAVVMPVSTGESMVLAPLCNQQKVLLLPPLADGDELTKARPFFYRVSPASSYQGTILAKAIRQQGHDKAAVLYLNDAWGQGLVITIKREFEAAGGRITTTESVSPGELDLRVQLARIKESDPSALVILLHPAETVPALRQIREIGLKAKLYGGDTFSNKAIYSEASDLAQGVIFALPSQPDNQIFKRFREEYETKYHAEADINAAAARDAIMIVAQAVREGAIDGDSIRHTLAQWPSGFEGATGLIKWDADGNVVSKSYTLYTIEGNTYRPLER